jgi:two-component system chemotaxis sensor kinase CheA
MKQKLQEKWNLKNKLIISFVAILTIPSITIGVLSYKSAKQEIESKLILSAEENVEVLDEILTDTITPIIKDVEMLSKKINTSHYEGDESPQIREIFSQYVGLREEILYVFVGTNKGLAVQEPRSKETEDYDPRERPWYKEAMEKKGQVVITAPYVSTSGDVIVSIVKKVNDNSGVVGIDLNMNKIAKLTQMVKIGNEGYAFIVDKNRRYIFHPTLESGSEAVEGFYDNLYQNETGHFEYELDGAIQKMSYQTNKLTGWKIAGTMHANEVDKSAYPIYLKTTIVMVLSLIIGALITYFIVNSIDVLVRQLKEKTKQLEEHRKLEQKLKEEAEEHSWIKTKIAEIATMYHEVENVQILAELLITKLVPMVGASYGVFYIKEAEDSQQYLKRLSAYAFSDENKEFERFRFGEGLIGQCAVDKCSMLLKHIPDNYIKIRSGIGVGPPKNVIIMPVQFEGVVLAVIEIASFEAFIPSQVKLLEEVKSNIGITINSILNRMKAEKLLQESQSLTEELQAQSEELQLQQEELRTTNEKLEEQYETSEQKKKEVDKVREALEEKAQQLELSSQYKSEFLANMSHELRTPLNSLLILAQILSENGEGNLTAKQEEYIRTIYSSGNDLLHLINDILDLAKVESGKIEVFPKEVGFHHVKDFIIKQFSPIARQKEVQFTVELDVDLPECIYTDEQRLQQILKNLLSNAFKFTESGSVSLIVRNVLNEGNGNQVFNGNNQAMSMLSFSVIDTGIGIAREKQETIFDAFKQADGTTSRQYGGTGLGLSISREFAQLLGGFIEVTSQKGIGSTFTLYLPNFHPINNTVEKSTFAEVAVVLEEENYLSNDTVKVNEEGPIKQHGKSLLKGKKILIVDDDIRNVYALTVALEKYEMNIIVAENGREGIEVLQDNPDTDLILMDIMMPDIDGFEAMQRIRKIHEFKTIPIIALTAKAMKNSREECLNAGATDYISKPLNLDQLFSLMQVWLYTRAG